MSEVLKYPSSETGFLNDYRHRVHAYLKEHGYSRYAGPQMWIQTAGTLGVFVALYSLLLSNFFSGLGLFFALIAMHFTLFYTTIGIAHDAAHDCYAHSKSANRAITRIFDLLGVSSHFWIRTHIRLHHDAPNVPLHDSAIESFALIRLHPKTKRRPVHDYQHVYMFLVYSMVTLFQVYLQEFVALLLRVTGFSKEEAPSMPRMIGMAASKTFMFTYSLLVPLIYINAQPWLILSGCFVGHMVCGVFIGVVFQTTHLAEGTAFPEPDERGYLPTPYPEHVFATTADFCPRSKFVTWITGGLNIHVAHHLMPNISQTHLIAMGKILKETAREYGLSYREFTLIGALRSHTNTLRSLGRGPSFEEAPHQEEPKAA